MRADNMVETTTTEAMAKMSVGDCKEIIDHSALCEKLTKLGKFADDIRERVEREKLRRNSHNLS